MSETTTLSDAVLDRIVAMARMLLASVDLDDLLPAIARLMARFSRCDRCVLADYDPETDLITGRAGFGVPPDLVKLVQLRLPDVPIARRALLESGPIIVDDPDAENAVPGEYLRLFDVRNTLAAVALRSDELGVLGFAMLDREGRDFDLDDQARQTLSVFADLASLAFQNGLLVERSRKLAAVLERSRLAADLHDGVSQILFSTGLRVEDALAQPGIPEEARAIMGHVQTEIRRASETLRQAFFELSEDLGRTPDIVVEIQHILQSFAERTGVSTDLDAFGQGTEPTESRRALVLRAVREGLVNVEKHAGATQVVVRLRRGRTWWSLEVDDDGAGSAIDVRSKLAASRRSAGVTATWTPGGFGLASLARDAQRLGGRIWVGQSQALGGISVNLSLPINQ